MKLSLVIPCYNEEEALPLFYEELCRVRAQMSETEFEILFVDDGSRDGTLALLKSFAEKDADVSYLSFSRNFGKESAMYAGFRNVSGDYVAVMDADMQDPPSLLPQILEILKSGEYDSVATCRKTRAGEPKIRSAFAHLFYRLMKKISSIDIVDGARDFRLMKKEMVDAIVSMSETSRFSKGIFGWIGFCTYWLPFENVNRVAGKTKWSFWKLFCYSIDGIVNFSDVPLKIPTFFGVCSLIASIVLLIVKMPYFALISLFGGLILCAIGILGLYLSEIHWEVKKRPQYIVAQSNKKDLHR